MERCYRRGIKCICWRVPEVNDSWIKELEEYLKNSFEFITELNNAKHPEETLYMVIGTQHGCVLYYSDDNDNFLRFAVAVGMSAHSHVYGGVGFFIRSGSIYRKVKLK
jgi:hypothetical protein